MPYTIYGIFVKLRMEDLGMKTHESLAQEIEKLAKEAGELKEEIHLHEYCRSHGMDYHDSGDYARAVNGLSKEQHTAGCVTPALPDSNIEREELLLSYTAIAEKCPSCYNGNDTDTRISLILDDLENVSRYGWFNDMGDLIKKKWREAKKMGEAVMKATGSRRNIRNNADATICVTGNTKDNKPELVYLRGRGTNSSPALYDADGVVILAGQRFYVDESAMRNKGRTYTAGVIKVKDAPLGWGNAEVCDAPGEKGAYYVHASWTEYLTLDQARAERWKLP
jgi:hypothetical protein